MFNTSNSSNGGSSSSVTTTMNNASIHHSSSANHLNASSNRLHDDINANDSSAMYMAPPSSSTPIQFGQQFYQASQAIEMYPRGSGSANNYYVQSAKQFNYYEPNQTSYNHENQMQNTFSSNENFYNYKAAYRNDIDDEDDIDNEDDDENEANMGEDAPDEPDEHHNLIVPSDNSNNNNHYQQYSHQNQNEIFNEYDMSHSSARFNSIQAQKIVPNMGNGSEFYQNNLLVANYNYCNSNQNYAATNAAATTENGLTQSQQHIDSNDTNAFNLYNMQTNGTQMQIEHQSSNNNLLAAPNAQFNALATTTNNVSHFDYTSLSLNEASKSDILNSKKLLPDWSHRSKSVKSSLTSRTKILCQVCGDKSSGFHFGVYTCEACKGFFRRCNKKYKTNQSGCPKQCVITKETRNNCSRCRFQRCISVGMAVEKIRFGKTPKHVAANLMLSASSTSAPPPPAPLASSTTSTTSTTNTTTAIPSAHNQYNPYTTSTSYEIPNYEHQARIDKLIKTLLSYFDAAKQDLSQYAPYSTGFHYQNYSQNMPNRLIHTQEMLIRLKEKIIQRLYEYINESNLNSNRNNRNSYEISINQLTPPSSSCSSSSSSSCASSISCSSASSCNTSTCSSSCPPPSSSSACSSTSNSSLVKPLTPQSNASSSSYHQQQYAMPYACQLRLSLSTESLFAAYIFLIIDEGVKMESNEFIGEVSALCNKSLFGRLSALFESIYVMGDDSNNRIVKTLHFILILLMQNLCSINSGSGVGKNMLDGESAFKLQRVITTLIALKCRNRKTKHRILLTLDNFLQF